MQSLKPAPNSIFGLGLVFTLLSPIALSDPAGMVRVGEFCIDKYEASLQIVSPDTEPQAVSVAGVLPQVNINQQEAQQACWKAGKRLCTDQEWLRACQSVAGFVYPYGNNLIQGACNDSGTLANTGAYQQCVTAEGALDMVGNVNEWTDDVYGTWRGGFFSDISIDGLGCGYRTTAFNTLHRDYRTGFRCCADDCQTSLQVQIDIKPGSDPNCFNINGHGVVPVAILGSATLDVADIDTETLYFGGLEVRVRGQKGPQCSFDDVNVDGFADLICQFEDDATSWSAGETIAELQGYLLGGAQFSGSGSICIVP